MYFRITQKEIVFMRPPSLSLFFWVNEFYYFISESFAVVLVVVLIYCCFITLRSEEETRVRLWGGDDQCFRNKDKGKCENSTFHLKNGIPLRFTSALQLCLRCRGSMISIWISNCCRHFTLATLELDKMSGGKYLLYSSTASLWQTPTLPNR